MAWVIVEVPVAHTYPLRRELLRHDRTDLNLRLPDDDVPGAFHLAAVDDTGATVGVVSAMPQVPDFAALPPAWRLRQMAVATTSQGRGAGSALFRGVLDRVLTMGAGCLWAESRDTSLGFYLARGMLVVPGRRHVVAGVAYTDVVITLHGTRG